MPHCIRALSFALVTIVATAPVHAQTAKVKIFIRADSTSINGQRFADKDLEDSANDLRKRPRGFDLVKNEADADLLFVVVKREQQTGKTGGLFTRKALMATISTRDGTSWKAATVLTKTEEAGWGIVAKDWMGDAEKWVKANFNK